MKKETGKVIEILLIEDNPGDVELGREALHEAIVKLPCRSLLPTKSSGLR